MYAAFQRGLNITVESSSGSPLFLADFSVGKTDQGAVHHQPLKACH